MKWKFPALIIAVLLTGVTIGCSRAASDPVAPNDSTNLSTDEAAHQLWGLWQFTIDPANQTLEPVPLRSTNLHLNALPFLEPPPGINLSVEYIQFNGDIITTDIGLRHPFLGLNQFTGFDVSGIFISSGNLAGFDDPDLVFAGDGDTRLINPDGYSRWWNPAEFPVNTGTIFGYNDGLLGTADAVGHYNSTLNAYKYYADGLDPEEPLADLNPSARGVFSAGQKNARRYIIKLESGLVFNYAVDASWKFPLGGQPWDVPDDFPPDANRPEAWRISVAELENTLYNDGNDSGGELHLSIDVYDHFNADLNTVKVESPGNFDPVSSSSPLGGGVGYSTYEIDITDATPAEDSIDLLITIECDISGYGGLLPGKAQAVYFFHRTDVSSGSPLEGIFVDGDNANDPLEDGTMEHPFDDILEAIYAAGVPPYEDIFDIYVDPYDDGMTKYPYFKFKQYARVHGYSWNGGPGKPLIDSNSEFGLMSDIDSCVVDNLEFHIECIYNNPESNCMQFWNSNGFIIKNCKFTGFGKGRATNLLRIMDCYNITIEHNEFVALRNNNDEVGSPGSSPWPGHTLRVISLENCPGYLISRNEFHDFGYDDLGDSTTYAWTIMYLVYMFDCHDSTFANNLIYDYNDFSKADPVGSPTEYTKNHAHLLYWSSTYPNNTLNFTFANNTFDDLSVTGGDTSVNAQGSATYGSRQDVSWIIKNNICSNWHDLTTVAQVNWHRGFWADGPGDHVPCDYSCCYNYGTPGAGVTVTGFTNMLTKGVGSYDFSDNQDPAYDMTPGPNWYHVTNPVLLSDDGSEMGAFGGPDGDWTPSSQE